MHFSSGTYSSVNRPLALHTTTYQRYLLSLFGRDTKQDGWSGFACFLLLHTTTVLKWCDLLPPLSHMVYFWSWWLDSISPFSGQLRRLLLLPHPNKVRLVQPRTKDLWSGSRGSALLCVCVEVTHRGEIFAWHRNSIFACFEAKFGGKGRFNRLGGLLRQYVCLKASIWGIGSSSPPSFLVFIPYISLLPTQLRREIRKETYLSGLFLPPFFAHS